MATGGLINPNPTIYQVSEIIRRDLLDLTDGDPDAFDSLEVFGTPFHDCERFGAFDAAPFRLPKFPSIQF
jgi:hypothetical protein